MRLLPLRTSCTGIHSPPPILRIWWIWTLPPLPILLELLVVIAILRLTFEGRLSQQVRLGPLESVLSERWRVQSGYTPIMCTCRD